MLKNDTLKNGTSRIGLYGSTPARGDSSQSRIKGIFVVFGGKPLNFSSVQIKSLLLKGVTVTLSVPSVLSEQSTY